MIPPMNDQELKELERRIAAGPMRQTRPSRPLTSEEDAYYHAKFKNARTERQIQQSQNSSAL